MKVTTAVTAVLLAALAVAGSAQAHHQSGWWITPMRDRPECTHHRYASSTAGPFATREACEDALNGDGGGNGGGGGGTAAASAAVGGSAVYLCHGHGYNPVVWSAQDAAKLLAQGDWFSSEAVPGNVAGGDNVGVYHLDCNNGFAAGFENTKNATVYVDHNGTLRNLAAARLAVAGQYPVNA